MQFSGYFVSCSNKRGSYNVKTRNSFIQQINESDRTGSYEQLHYIYLHFYLFYVREILFNQGIFFVMGADIVSKTYLGAFFLILKEQDFPKLTVRMICPFRTLWTKCQALLQCLDPLLMPCDTPVKVMHTTYCHVENDPCSVKEETDERQMERYGADKWKWRRDTWCIVTLVCVWTRTLRHLSFVFMDLSFLVWWLFIFVFVCTCKHHILISKTWRTPEKENEIL